MASKDANFFARIKVPHPNGPVVRTCDENRIGRVGESGVILKTHDTIGMTLFFL